MGPFSTRPPTPTTPAKRRATFGGGNGGVGVTLPRTQKRKEKKRKEKTSQHLTGPAAKKVDTARQGPNTSPPYRARWLRAPMRSSEHNPMCGRQNVGRTVWSWDQVGEEQGGPKACTHRGPRAPHQPKGMYGVAPQTLSLFAERVGDGRRGEHALWPYSSPPHKSAPGIE